jgi:hypothetical protein
MPGRDENGAYSQAIVDDWYQLERPTWRFAE